MADLRDEWGAGASVPPPGVPQSGDAGGSSVHGDGLSWCWSLDLAALLAAVSGLAPWLRATGEADPVPADGAVPAGGAVLAGAGVDPEADEAEYQEAMAAGRAGVLPLGVVAGRVAESLPAGPGLAGWLAQARMADLEDGALAGVASSFRRLASWATAGELAAVAQIASRSARSDRRAEVDSAGRPDRITADAAGQVALALAMSQDGASDWTDLGVVLTWRLPATGAALDAGEIDLARARMIVRMTTPLDDAAARAAEAAVLERAGWLTLGQLHAALRQAVIKADPEGAERRREEAERRAKVVIYPEDEGTATLAGYCLPGVHASAAMARITALAKALRAAGALGSMDLVRAQVFLGLLLGTLPGVPPGGGASAGPSPGDQGASADPAGPAGRPSGGDSPSLADSEGSAGGCSGGGLAGGSAGGCDDGDPRGGDPDGGDVDDGDFGDDAASDEAGAWPDVLPSVVAGSAGLAGPAGLDGIQPVVGGLLDLAVPFATLAGSSAAHGKLSRLGVVTAGQARQLAALAAQHPATRWQIVVTTPEGQAIAVTHLPRGRASPSSGQASTSPGGGAGLIRRVTLIIGADALDTNARDTGALDADAPGPPGPAPPHPPGAPPTGSPLAVILERTRAAAVRVAEQVAVQAQADARAGGCAHGLASAAYRPPPRIAELVTVRDGTCRFGTCRRPAEQCDLDHTIPFDQGGLTCSCNLGGQCRSHHQLKQHPGWSLTQPNPGVFRWTTPAGRTYTVRPDHLVTG
jgi:hypothetical protein